MTANYSFSVFRQTNQGNSTGKSDAFLNLTQGGESVAFQIKDRGEESWVFKAAKLYHYDPQQPGEGNETKQNDMKTNLNSGQTNKFTDVFGPPLQPGSTAPGSDGAASYGISADGKTLTVTNSSANSYTFEFLLWIQNGSRNDYVDPGIRNDF